MELITAGTVAAFAAGIWSFVLAVGCAAECGSVHDAEQVLQGKPLDSRESVASGTGGVHVEIFPGRPVGQ